jgi:hypothetical protein
MEYVPAPLHGETDLGPDFLFQRQKIVGLKQARIDVAMKAIRSPKSFFKSKIVIPALTSIGWKQSMPASISIAMLSRRSRRCGKRPGSPAHERRHRADGDVGRSAHGMRRVRRVRGS